MMRTATVALATTLLLAACRHDDGEVWTLYRSSPIAADLTIHVATFDTVEGKGYNRDGCEIARQLFQDHTPAGEVSRYWCERGRAKDTL